MPARPKDVRIVCGLGNPGEEYRLTRHNVGFLTVDRVAEDVGVRYWKSECGCMVADVTIGGREVLLAKPQDFMNTSGGPLSKLARKRHVSPAEILVVHDEVDLEPGVIKVKFGGGLNAHNGLRSVAAKLGTRDFARVRIGIGRPPGRMQVADYVLRRLKGQLAEELLVTCADAAEVVRRCVTDGVTPD